MVVTPGTLRRHIAWLRATFEIMRLQDWLDRARRKEHLPKRAVALSFDDGWRDNFEFALPILFEERVPATLFLATDFIGTTRQFWPNRLLRVLRNDYLRTCSADEVQWLRARLRTDPSMSTADLSALVAHAKQLPEQELIACLDRIEDKWGLGEGGRSLLSWAEVREMVDSGCIDIGSHGCSHLRLREGISQETLYSEVVESKMRIQRELGKVVPIFCYPNGDSSKDSERLVREHYRAAVTTRAGINTPRTDPYRLHRMAVHEDIASAENALLARLSGL